MSPGMCVLTYCSDLAIFQLDVLTQPITIIRSHEHRKENSAPSSFKFALEKMNAVRFTINNVHQYKHKEEIVIYGSVKSVEYVLESWSVVYLIFH